MARYPLRGFWHSSILQDSHVFAKWVTASSSFYCVRSSMSRFSSRFQLVNNIAGKTATRPGSQALFKCVFMHGVIVAAWGLALCLSGRHMFRGLRMVWLANSGVNPKFGDLTVTNEACSAQWLGTDFTVGAGRNQGTGSSSHGMNEISIMVCIYWLKHPRGAPQRVNLLWHVAYFFPNFW